MELICGDNLCEGNSSNPEFIFNGTEFTNESPQSICRSGCTAQKVNGVSLTFESGGFVSTYQPTDTQCQTETNGSILSQTQDNKTTFDLDNSSVDAFKDQEQCATDSIGNETCVPLVEAGTASCLLYTSPSPRDRG